MSGPVVQHISHKDAWPVGRDMQDVGSTTKSGRSARTSPKECPKRTLRRGTEQERTVYDTQQDSETSDQELDMAGTKIFNFHSI